MGRTSLGLPILLLILEYAAAELLINVQNQGGEIVQETITSNVSEDIITLEFQRTDGTLVTELIDFRNEVHVLKALVLGEEERGQSQYQVMCFVTKLQRGDFISSDAMAKLRQKNPNTIRTPEEDRGKENYTMSGWLAVDKASVISRHIPGMCQEAAESTYVRDSDLKLWAEIPGGSSSLSLDQLVAAFPATPSRCRDVSGLWTPCTCTLELCIGWYPCELKYCTGKVDALEPTSYRCGIKTCRRCNQFSYHVSEKQQCLWDD